MKKCILAGFGMGLDTLTEQTVQALKKASCICAAKRITDEIRNSYDVPCYDEYLPEKILEIFEKHKDGVCAALFSGDTGFYSGCTKLCELLQNNGWQVEVYSGISSVQYFASRLCTSWQDWHLVSAHGVEGNPFVSLARHEKVFFLTGGKYTAYSVADFLVKHDAPDAKMYVGSCLMTRDEKIISGTAKELLQNHVLHNNLCVVLVEQTIGKYGAGALPDSAFIRNDKDKKTVPMTKQMVRSAILSLLHPCDGEVIWDIGCGTGAVSIDISRSCDCSVYAVESDIHAFELEKLNRKKFNALNLELFHGCAPEDIKEFPSPDGVFIGGSKGNIREILELVKSKNDRARVVVACVTLETLTQSQTVLKELYGDYNAVLINASESKILSDYHLMTSQNPVWLLSATCDA